MWVPNSLIDLFHIGRSTVDGLREELSAVRAERDALKLQSSISQNHFDWLRVRTNQLEFERAQLLEKAYGIKTPIPEIVRTSVSPIEFNNALFEDVGEKTARELGLPVYGDEFHSEK